MIFTILSTYFLYSADKTRVAVVNLSAKTGIAETTAATITDLLSGELVALKKFDMVDRANMDKVLKEQSLQNTGCTEQACAVKLGNILNVQKLVVGTVSKLGDNIIISISFVDVEKSHIDMSEKVTAESENDIVSKVHELALKIDNQVGIVGRIISVYKNGNLMINIGSDEGLKLGGTLALSRPGNAIIDQSTGDLLGKEVIDLGIAKVMSLDSGGTLCTAKPVSDKVALKEGDLVLFKTEKKIIESEVSSSKKSAGGKPNKFLGLTILAAGLSGGSFLTGYLLDSDATSKRTTYRTTYNSTDATSQGDAIDNQINLANGFYIAAESGIVITGAFLILTIVDALGGKRVSDYHPSESPFHFSAYLVPNQGQVNFRYSF